MSAGTLPGQTPCLSSPHAPGCRGAGAQPGGASAGVSFSHGAKGTCCNRARLGLALASLGPPLQYMPCVFLLLSHGQPWCGGPVLAWGPVLPWSRGLTRGSRASRHATPAITCFSKCWGEGSQKATGSHFSRSLYLVANAPFTPSASSFPSAVRLNPVFSL